MSNTKLFIAISRVIPLFLMTSVVVGMSAPYGWYAEGNLGSTRLINEDYPANSSNSSSGLGGNINVGYKFMPYVGVELGYTRYANTTIDDQNSTEAGSDKHYSYDLAGKGIIPIGTGNFELFGKFGIQRIYSSISISNTTAANNIGLGSGQHSTTGYYLGVGGEYYFSPEFAAVAQWARANGNSSTGTLDLYSVGVSYIF
ncbi:MAG: hypothetical protein A3F11_08830 [Gammaproteobacteria bacterium RIFCSPHIGHO2_12_FULL_37_14]|nr:MAG: hypothetical protein A3F11_08830 [Gammaproteobacteria bacterium RIFCSPHIGHO2_12_FULL_37_14]